MIDKTDTISHSTPLGRYLRRFTVRNVRTFRSPVTLDFCHEDGSIAQWTIILGENGTGKTTLLQFLAGMRPIDKLDLRRKGKAAYGPAFLDPKWNGWHVANMPNMPKANAEKNAVVAQLRLSVASSSILFADPEKSNTYAIDFHCEISADRPNTGPRGAWAEVESEFVDQVRLFAYGSSRHVAGPASPYVSSESFFQNGETDPTTTLFHDDFPLISPEQWFLGLDHASNLKGSVGRSARRAFESAKRCLKNALPGLNDLAVKPQNLGKAQPVMTLMCTTPFGEVPFSALSVGYRTMAAWLTDFIKRMHDSFPQLVEPDDGPAIVLIDEFDLHMHPSWQRKSMEALSKEFPNTQFIVTAHSPLVVQAANKERAKIVVLQRRGREDGLEEVTIVDHPTEAAGWRVDQILESLYGVSSRSPRYDELTQTRVLLRQKKILSATERTHLNNIEIELDQLAPPDEAEASQALLEDLKKALQKACDVTKRV